MLLWAYCKMNGIKSLDMFPVSAWCARFKSTPEQQTQVFAKDRRGNWDVWLTQQRISDPSWSVSVVCCLILWFLRTVQVFWFSQSYSTVSVLWRPSGRCLGLDGSSWPLFWENRPLPWTQPSRLHLGTGSDSVRLYTKPRSDLNGHRSCTTSPPSGSGHSSLQIIEKQ